MKLEGIHHITAITGDAQANVDFYVDVLGLRLVKKSVNQDDPTVYHLFYADERGSAGSDITFFEYPGAAPGRAGAGMIHRVVWRVGSPAAMDFWADRLASRGISVERTDGGLIFADPERLEHELIVDESGDDPLTAEHPEIPAEHRLRGFDGVRAYGSNPEASRGLLEQTLGFEPGDDAYEVRGERRGGRYAYDAPPAERGIPGGGTVHHVAWGCEMDDQPAWRGHLIEGGAHPTPVIERFYFRSVYFREPSGVLFEIATLGPGFSVDEDPEHLGEAIALPPDYEPLRAEVERRLTPLQNPRERWAAR
jgi:glyoxalase family protein